MIQQRGKLLVLLKRGFVFTGQMQFVTLFVALLFDKGHKKGHKLQRTRVCLACLWPSSKICLHKKHSISFVRRKKTNIFCLKKKYDFFFIKKRRQLFLIYKADSNLDKQTDLLLNKVLVVLLRKTKLRTTTKVCQDLKSIEKILSRF